MTQVPVTRCQYCGSQDIGEGWQHGEALVTFKYHGLLGNRLKYLICRSCGAPAVSTVAKVRMPTYCSFCKQVCRSIWVCLLGGRKKSEKSAKWGEGLYTGPILPENRPFFEGNGPFAAGERPV